MTRQQEIGRSHLPRVAAAGALLGLLVCLAAGRQARADDMSGSDRHRQARPIADNWDDFGPRGGPSARGPESDRPRRDRGPEDRPMPFGPPRG